MKFRETPRAPAGQSGRATSFRSWVMGVNGASRANHWPTGANVQSIIAGYPVRHQDDWFDGRRTTWLASWPGVQAKVLDITRPGVVGWRPAKR